MVKSDGKIHALGRAHIGVLAHCVWALPPNAEGNGPYEVQPHRTRGGKKKDEKTFSDRKESHASTGRYEVREPEKRADSLSGTLEKFLTVSRSACFHDTVCE